MQSCRMYVGRLVSHPCGRKTRAVCPGCGAPVCELHLDAASARCLRCAGRYAPPPAPIQVSFEEMMHFDERDLAAFDAPAQPSPLESYRDS